MQTTAHPSRRPIVLVTRPEPEGAAFAAELAARHGDAVRLIRAPIMEIVRDADLPDLKGIETLVFTSRNGVRAYAAATARREIPCYAVGDATAEAARAEGLSAISAEGDARALVALMIADRVRGPVMQLHGTHRAGDIPGALRAAGIEARAVPIYDQRARPLSPEARRALRGDAPVVLPLFSPRSAELVINDTPPTCPLVAAVISEAARDRLPDPLARDAIVAARPDGPAMHDAVTQAIATAKRLEGAKGTQ
ncbi:uroporphyrinogen-III synthase [Roseovarius spongiae]|uniref:Uroporphyrinogen-III synthase n=1 Tax=Roseovarius spongiae TaxID=2320272 RepID=A0A3A8B405_9RHOB|nr:uroporphyrinogen-III synthase [Roseovarius spongiae]RKF16301.1 uroporphyrinogen-III synthase [Roseovarius spongiae]